MRTLYISVADIYRCLPPDKIWHKVFFIVGILREREYVRHKLTGCNVSLMSPLGLGVTKSNESSACMPTCSLNSTWRSSAMLGCQWLFAHPKVAWPELRAIQPWFYHWSWYAIQHEYQADQQKKSGTCFWTRSVYTFQWLPSLTIILQHCKQMVPGCE